jgi:hypothetical protein
MEHSRVTENHNNLTQSRWSPLRNWNTASLTEARRDAEIWRSKLRFLYWWSLTKTSWRLQWHGFLCWVKCFLLETHLNRQRLRKKLYHIWTYICHSSPVTVFDSRGDKLSTANSLGRESYIKTDSPLSSQKIYPFSWKHSLVEIKETAIIQ